MVYPCVEESDRDSVEDRLSSIYSQKNRQWEHIKKKKKEIPSEHLLFHMRVIESLTQVAQGDYEVFNNEIFKT